MRSHSPWTNDEITRSQESPQAYPLWQIEPSRQRTRGHPRLLEASRTPGGRRPVDLILSRLHSAEEELNNPSHFERGPHLIQRRWNQRQITSVLRVGVREPSLPKIIDGVPPLVAIFDPVATLFRRFWASFMLTSTAALIPAIEYPNFWELHLFVHGLERRIRGSLITMDRDDMIGKSEHPLGDPSGPLDIPIFARYRGHFLEMVHGLERKLGFQRAANAHIGIVAAERAEPRDGPSFPVTGRHQTETLIVTRSVDCRSRDYLPRTEFPKTRQGAMPRNRCRRAGTRPLSPNLCSGQVDFAGRADWPRSANGPVRSLRGCTTARRALCVCE